MGQIYRYLLLVRVTTDTFKRLQKYRKSVASDRVPSIAEVVRQALDEFLEKNGFGKEVESYG